MLIWLWNCIAKGFSDGFRRDTSRGFEKRGPFFLRHDIVNVRNLVIGCGLARNYSVFQVQLTAHILDTCFNETTSSSIIDSSASDHITGNKDK